MLHVDPESGCHPVSARGQRVSVVAARGDGGHPQVVPRAPAGDVPGPVARRLGTVRVVGEPPMTFLIAFKREQGISPHERRLGASV
jgi:hypothetical protein